LPTEATSLDLCPDPTPRTETGHDGDDLGRPSDGRGAAGARSVGRGGRL